MTASLEVRCSAREEHIEISRQTGWEAFDYGPQPWLRAEGRFVVFLLKPADKSPDKWSEVRVVYSKKGNVKEARFVKNGQIEKLVKSRAHQKREIVSEWLQTCEAKRGR